MIHRDSTSLEPTVFMYTA